MAKERVYSIDHVEKAAVHGIKTCLNKIVDHLRHEPHVALAKVRKEDTGKLCYVMDLTAEDSLNTALRNKLSGIQFFAEERFGNDHPDLAGRPGWFALGDALDGSELAARGLLNWCSAVVIFHPTSSPGERILAAAVGLPTGEIYHAAAQQEGAFVEEDCLKGARRKVSRPVRGPSRVKLLKNAAVCYNGQKVSGLVPFLQLPLLDKLSSLNDESIKKGEDRIPFRFYNFAGIPMMMRLIDHRGANYDGIDAVFSLGPQKAHDVVAGAFIAKKAGALLQDTAGNPISDIELEEALMKPLAPRITCMLSATPELAADLRTHLMKGIASA